MGRTLFSANSAGAVIQEGWDIWPICSVSVVHGSFPLRWLNESFLDYSQLAEMLFAYKLLLPTILLKFSMIYSILEIPLPRSDSVHSNISNVTGIQIPNSLHWFPWNFLIFPPHENIVPFCCKLQKLKPFGFFHTIFVKIFPWTGPQILPLSSMFPLLIMPQRQGEGLSDIYKYFCCSPSQWCQLTTWQ